MVLDHLNYLKSFKGELILILACLSSSIGFTQIDKSVIASAGEVVCRCLKNVENGRELQNCYKKKYQSYDPPGWQSDPNQSNRGSNDVDQMNHKYSFKEYKDLVDVYIKKNCPYYEDIHLKFYAFPTNIKGMDLKKINEKKKYKRWIKNYLSVYCKIVEIKQMGDFYFLKVEKSDHYAWVKYNLDFNSFTGQVGTFVRVLGTIVPKHDSLFFEEKEDYFISPIAICINSNKQVFFDSVNEKEVEIWREGYIPRLKN